MSRTPPPDVTEAQEVSLAFQAALAAYGASAVLEATDLWSGVNAENMSKLATSSAAWLERMLSMILHRRSKARALALAYYRLRRALLTGETVPDPMAEGKPPTRESLSDLRGDFWKLAQAASPKISPPRPQPDRQIPVTKPLLTREDLDQMEEDEVGAAKAALIITGPARVRDKIKKGKDKPTEKGAVTTAAEAEMAVLNGARGTIYLAGGRDAKVIGWVRLSRTGTPCGFCAMLISRGFKRKYRSKATAEPRAIYQGEEIGTVHPGCHCYAMEVYSEEHYQNDPRFDLNREYARLWPQVTKGLGGRDALNAWRRFITARNKAAGKAADKPIAAAQAAEAA